MWRTPTEEQGGVLWETETDRRRNFGASPFHVVDPGFNAILLRSCCDLAAKLCEPEIEARARSRAARGLQAMESLWDHGLGQCLCFDRKAGTRIDSPSVGGLIAAFAPIPEARAAAIARRIELLADQCEYVVPSHDPRAPEFDGLRYWRGPVWLIVNYLIADGMKRAAQDEIARRIVDDSMKLIGRSGFAEYYDPMDATPCGGGRFTWTAAMVMEFLKCR